MPKSPSPSNKKHTFIISETTPESEPNSLPTTSPKSKILLKILGIIFTLILIVGLGFGATLWWYATGFAQAAGITKSQLISHLRQGWHTTPQTTQGQTHMLILGLDAITDQKEGSMLTDTIIVASLDYHQSRLSLTSLPRDLWIDSLKTKINALYYYGDISEQTTGEQLSSTIVEEITGLPIHYVFVVNLDTLEQVINTLDGVDIDVPFTFTDNKFPRSDVDLSTATSEAELYETITFEQGITHMDGSRALKYIRSRHSDDPEAGTDNARGSRQQQLVQAIITKLKTKSVLQNPYILGNLYKLYLSQIKTNLTQTELIAIGRQIGTNPPDLHTISLPIQDNGTPGVLYHPPVEKYKQWVYEPLDQSWAGVAEHIQTQLQSN